MFHSYHVPISFGFLLSISEQLFLPCLFHYLITLILFEATKLHFYRFYLFLWLYMHAAANKAALTYSIPTAFTFPLTFYTTSYVIKGSITVLSILTLIKVLVYNQSKELSCCTVFLLCIDVF